MGSYRAWEPNAIGSIVPPFAGGATSGGGGGGQTQDHQCPRFIVGNALAGDTAFVCDFLDPGDGSGITAALAASALVPGVASADVCVRPGIYTPPAGTLPFTVPANTTLSGAGPSTLLRNLTTQRQVFVLGAGAILKTMRVEVGNAPVGSVGLEVASLATGTMVQGVQVQLLGVTVDETLTAFLRTVPASTRARVTEVNLLGAGQGLANIVLDGTDHSVEDVVVEGAATGAVVFRPASNRCVADNVRGQCHIGFVVSGDRHTVDGSLQCSTLGADVAANRCRLRLTAYLTAPAPGSVGVRVFSGTANVVEGCVLEGFDVGASVLAGATRTIVVGNQLEAVTSAFLDAGTLTESAHNQLVP